MIEICIKGHGFKNEIFDMARLFYRDEEIWFTDEPREDFRGIFVLSRLTKDKDRLVLYNEVSSNGVSLKDEYLMPVQNASTGKESYDKKPVKRELKRRLYLLLSKLENRNLPWGMLTGIRPAKIVHEMMNNKMNKEEIFKSLREYYMVSEHKADLAYDVAKAEKEFLDRTSPDMISLYVGIPFCPTRCLYCSFTSNPISRYEKMVGGYLEALFEEIRQVSRIVKKNKYRIQSIYIGGGTPTSICAEDIASLLNHLESQFELSGLEEYTLEAGRPDSITQDKLLAIKSSMVDRISINPQSMNEETLKVIGRKHTPEDIENSFRLARELGFDNINMDVIIGLPGENEDMFRYTMDKLRDLGPDSLTVHTMSIKRASKLNEEKDKYQLQDEAAIMAMADCAGRYAAKMDMHPYYLYRQKNILGNLENVGYCKPGKESIYNIQIMEERQTIIAMGAGAVTKVVYPEENRIERAFNVKGVEEYISRLEEMVERKKALLK